MSIAVHLLAYNLTSTPLFRAGIMESGAPTTENYASAADVQPFYDAIVKDTGCAGAKNTLACLRALPFDVWNHAVNASSSNGTWSPVVDGQIVPSYPTPQLAAQKFVHVPLLLGGKSTLPSRCPPVYEASAADLILNNSTANSDEGTAYSQSFYTCLKPCVD